MAVVINQTVVGNVGNVYEKRVVGKDNRSVIDFSVAATRRVRDANGEWKDGEPYWVNVTAWGRLADNIETSFRSGDPVFVSGRIEMSDPYVNKKTNEQVPARPKLIAEVAGLEISAFGAKSEKKAKASGSNTEATASTKKPAQAKVEDDDEFDFDFGNI